jgi:hypothetical protein
LTTSRKTKGRRATAADAAPIIRHRGRNASGAAVVGLLAAAGLLAACGRGGDWRSPAPQQDQPAEGQTGYVPPPRFTAVERLADGAVRLSGAADPNVRVRVASPDGVAYFAASDAKGVFSVTAPAAAAVRLFGLSETLANRVIQGEGYLAVLPAPGRPAVLLRAGAGAHAPGASSIAPQVVAVDLDGGGGAVVSGVARPGSALRLTLDGRHDGDARADAKGRFAFALAAVLKPGDHQLSVQSAAGQDDARFSVGQAPPISGLPFRAARQAGDWRVDWLTPAGGEQTTLVMD